MKSTRLPAILAAAISLSLSASGAGSPDTAGGTSTQSDMSAVPNPPPNPAYVVQPKPASMTPAEGALEIGPDLGFACTEKSLLGQVEFCAGLLRAATGWKIPVGESGQVRFALDAALPPEGYKLSVRKDGARIAASTPRGIFYGFQTLRQLMPVEAFARSGKAACPWMLPCLEITDHPRFAWRGILVDVSRHFQTKEAMMNLIDAMAMAKLNTLHWHLTDDQGWRIEIKAFPKLAADSKQFYTQEEIREVVAYAAKRAVTVVPEIDVPGHSYAAIRSYPMLGCKLKNGKMANVYNPAKESTYEFLDKVFAEVASLFPAAHIHLGADEVGMGAWKQDPDCQAFIKKHSIENLHDLQTHFIKRVGAIIQKHGKTPVAWDEALGGGLGKDLVIMSWRGMKPGSVALARGHHVVFCPVSSLYFDRSNSRSAANPQGFSDNTINLHRVYFFRATPPTLPAAQKNLVLGAQGNIWGERIKSADHMLRMAMLRGCALGGALWSDETPRDWNGFMQRLVSQRYRLDAMGIAYFWEPDTTAVQAASWKSSELPAGKPTTLKWDVSEFVGKPGLYEFTFENTGGPGTFNVLEAKLLADGNPVAADIHAETVTLDPRRPNQYYLLKIDAFKPGAKYELSATLAPVKGGAAGAVMFIPAPEKYSKWGDPESGCNRSGQKQPDES